MEHAEPDRDNRSNRNVLAASDRREEVDAFVIRNNNLASKGTIPFLRIVLLWLVLVGLIFGLLLSLVEKLPFLDAFWIAFNACTATGLTINNLAHFDVGGQALVALAMQLGSATLLSLTPVLIRIRSVHTILPEDVRSRTFNLKHYKRVPEWIIEYKALRILARHFARPCKQQDQETCHTATCGKRPALRSIETGQVKLCNHGRSH